MIPSMKRYIPFILLAVLGLLINACYYDEELVLPQDNEPITEEVSFSADIQPLFDQSCVQCHGGNLNIAPILESDVAYDNLINEGYVIPLDGEASILYRSLIGDGVALMPPSAPWNSQRINTVKAWIDQGAEDN